MKKLIMSFVMAAFAAGFTSCEKSTSNNGPEGLCGSTNVNLCFDLDGNTVSVNAVWYDINANRHRILWEENSGGGYKNIEIDLYGSLTASTYTIVDNASANGEAAFQYYINGSTSANYEGTNGSIVISSTANNTISGTFDGVVTNAATNYNLTNGKIDVVPHQ